MTEHAATEAGLSPIARFRESLQGPNLIARIRNGLIGDDAMIDGPYGQKHLVYADYVASGRALMQVETFIMNEILPFYANSHTEASYCGAFMTKIREEARATIASLVGATPGCQVIFTGSGATAGLNRLVHLFGVNAACAADERPLVLIGPYEHHSNILPWRESGAEVIEIDEHADGGPDLDQIEQALSTAAPGRLKICAFSAASNVTGIVCDVDAVTGLAKRHGALAVWDYAGGAPYLSIDMNPGPGLEKDAVVLSPHKFTGGPSASGVLIVREKAVVTDRPTWPGGGTVSFVSPWSQDYSKTLAAREEAGTPNVIGDIRAALALIIKDTIGQNWIDLRNMQLVHHALEVWRSNPNIQLLGNLKARRLPIFSFRVLERGGARIHHQLFTRMLSDRFGIQARGGCACAGPYAHRLLDIDRDGSEAIRGNISNREEIEKPGWVRLNLSYLMTDEKVDMIVRSVDQLARAATDFESDYVVDPTTARFKAAATS